MDRAGDPGLFHDFRKLFLVNARKAGAREGLADALHGHGAIATHYVSQIFLPSAI
jgi:hypothetical protein